LRHAEAEQDDSKGDVSQNKHFSQLILILRYVHQQVCDSDVEDRFKRLFFGTRKAVSADPADGFLPRYILESPHRRCHDVMTSVALLAALLADLPLRPHACTEHAVAVL
jgi:hypothetical protein